MYLILLNKLYKLKTYENSMLHFWNLSFIFLVGLEIVRLKRTFLSIRRQVGFATLGGFFILTLKLRAACCRAAFFMRFTK